MPPAPELVTRSVRVYCAKVKQGDTAARAKTASVLIADLILVFFLSGSLCAEALVADGLAICSELGRAGQEPDFLPEAINRNANVSVPA